MKIPSPCISICAIDEATGQCKGCFRTTQEVGMWLYYSEDEKKALLLQLKQRAAEAAKR